MTRFLWCLLAFTFWAPVTFAESTEEPPVKKTDLREYPGPIQEDPDTYAGSEDSLSLTPIAASYEERKKLFLEFSAQGGTTLFSSMARAKLGKPSGLDTAWLTTRLTHIASRVDTVDFELNRQIRGLYFQKDHPKNPLYTPDQLKMVEKTVLEMKYWLDQPGQDTMITFTENHMILFHAAEYLAGQYFRDQIFPNSQKNGRWHQAHAKPLIKRWIELKAGYGFFEWDSNVYYNEDLPALFNLADYAEDPEIKTLATMAIDLMVLDMANDHFYGMYPTSHGRSYADHNKWPYRHSMAGPMKLLFGTGVWGGREHFTGSMMAVGNYRPPPALVVYGQDFNSPHLCKESHGASIKEAKQVLKWDPKNIDDMTLFWSAGWYVHPDVLVDSLIAFDKYDQWDLPFLEEAQKLAAAIPRDHRLAALARSLDIEPMRTYLGRANKVTWRTPDYMLSSAQSYRPGEAGNQHVIWKAAFKGGTQLFVNNPGAMSDKERAPAYWANDNRLPRTAQFKNVLISIYQLPKKRMAGERALWNFTHAWLPKDQYDEINQQGKWIFVRKGKAYAAIFASNKIELTKVGREKDREVLVRGDKVAWVVQMGREADDDSFKQFKDKISKTTISVSTDSTQVSYQAPGVGSMKFGWKGDFLVNKKSIPLEWNEQFDCPGIKKMRGQKQLVFKKGKHSLFLDFEKGIRKIE